MECEEQKNNTHNLLLRPLGDRHVYSCINLRKPYLYARSYLIQRIFRFNTATLKFYFVRRFSIRLPTTLRFRMALFARQDAGNIDMLLCAGFIARLRLLKGDVYLGVASSGESLARVPRDEAAALHFSGKPGSPKVAVRVSADRYIDMDAPGGITSTPALVRIDTATHARGSLRIALRSLRNPVRYAHIKNTEFALTAASNAGAEPPTEAWFELEVLVVPAVDWITAPVGVSALSAAQACITAALVAGTRFRLRSVHNRVLHVGAQPDDIGDSEKTGKSANESRDTSSTAISVLQNGPKTGIDETNNSEIVFEPVQRGTRHLFRDVASGRYLAFRPGTASNEGSIAALVPESEATNQSAGTHLIVEGAYHHWGDLHLGIALEDLKKGDGSSTAKNDTNPDSERTDTSGHAVEWLMAGPRGRLESRQSKRAWEQFHMELVEQSKERTLQELQPSSVFDIAEKETEARMRASIRAEVDVARASKPKNTGGFNHARALAALSDPEPAAKKPVVPKPEESQTESTDGTASVHPTAVHVAADAAPPTSSGSLPRAAQNRKLTKREKRKKKRKAASAAAAAAAAAASSPSPSKPKQAPKSSSGGETGSASGSAPDEGSSSTVTAEDESTAVPSEQSASSSALAGASGGPACGACGRGISGIYTKALGKSFHPGCLVCAHCRCTLAGTGKLHTHKGAPYCVRCYANHAAPRCARCVQPIMDTVVTAMERTWHRECLTCVYCRNPLSETFWIYADKPREPHCNECVGARAQPNTNRRVGMPGYGQRNLGSGATLDSAVGGSGSARLHMPMLRPPGHKQ